ncbi:MAG: hypothetical protein JO147_08380 [Actinobacteria bacterium]|nr:hypothetical protein [Actinomycetota bacterium]
MLVNEAWQRIDAASEAGHEGAIALQSFFIGQVVGSFQTVRPAALITQEIVAECEERIAALGALMTLDPVLRCSSESANPRSD